MSKFERVLWVGTQYSFFSLSNQFYTKMSSSLISPFASALPASHVFFQYDSDGDAIMTDAHTGLPITYGGSVPKRNRSDSSDSDSADSRPSKRSRTSSDDDGADGSGGLSPIKIPRAPVGIPTTVCPGAPKKALPPIPPSPVAAAAEDSDESPVRNLAVQMAEAVLAGEPRDPPAETTASSASNAAAEPQDAAAETTASSASNAAAEPPPGGEPQDWNISVYCSDLALRLDMRHPRVVLNFLRFVDSYNELAPFGEEIHLPYIDAEGRDLIFSHVSLVNPPAEFAREVAELRSLVDRYSCQCPDCVPDNWSESHEEYSEEERERDRYRYDSD